MIHRDAIVTVARIPISRIVVAQVEPKFLSQVQIYASMLESNPDHYCGLVSVAPLEHDYYELLDGHHRFCASIMTGRTDILATVVDERRLTHTH